MFSRLSLIIPLLFCLTGCWRLADPGGCQDWELIDYPRSEQQDYSECPHGEPCFIYRIEACSSTLGVNYHEYIRSFQKSLVIQASNKFEELVASTGTILADCRVSQTSGPTPIWAHVGGSKIWTKLLCTKPVSFPPATAGDNRPYSERFFPVLK